MACKPPFSRGRGRVADPERAAQTRELIRQAALANFLDCGFERTRMADVAARAGLAKGTLYLHFADKEGLFEFVLQQLVSEPLARLQAVPAPPGERARAGLERLFLPMLRDFELSGRAAVLRLIITEGSRFPALAEIHRRLVIEPMMLLIDQIIRAEDGLDTSALSRFPQLMAAPVIMAAVWNGIWAADEKVDASAMFVGFLDAVFGTGP